MLKPGLYEQIISQSLSRDLASVSDACKHVEKLDAAEAPQALAGYVAEAVRATLEAMPSGAEEQSAQRIALVNEMLDVLYLPEKKIDVFLITLNKSDKDYSPTTMYEDYAISPSLFHWQSQSTTAADSPTGRRYIHHTSQGGRILLFVREFKQDALGTSPYTFLGQATYVRHTGNKPMNIVWKLEKPIPAKYLKQVQQAMG